MWPQKCQNFINFRSFQKMAKFSEKRSLVSCRSFFSALPGAHAPWRVHSPPMRDPIWLVETEIAFLCRQAVFYRTTPGEIVPKMVGGFSENYFTKMKISQDPVVRSWRKPHRIEIIAQGFGFWKREVQENSTAWDRPPSRSAKMMIFFGKTLAGEL